SEYIIDGIGPNQVIKEKGTEFTTQYTIFLSSRTWHIVGQDTWAFFYNNRVGGNTIIHRVGNGKVIRSDSINDRVTGIRAAYKTSISCCGPAEIYSWCR